MKVIIDECVYSLKFEKELQKELPNHDVIYLGNGLLDIDIERYMLRHDDAVLVTADTEFDTHFGWDKSLYVRSSDSIRDRVNLIRAWLNE